eukprot:578555-Rhodomonas_salina.1
MLIQTLQCAQQTHSERYVQSEQPKPESRALRGAMTLDDALLSTLSGQAGTQRQARDLVGCLMNVLPMGGGRRENG